METLKHLNLTRRGASSHCRYIGEGREGIAQNASSSSSPCTTGGQRERGHDGGGMETLKPPRSLGQNGGSSGDPSFVSLASFPQGPIPPPYSAPPLLCVLSPLLVADSDVGLQKKKKTGVAYRQ